MTAATIAQQRRTRPAAVSIPREMLGGASEGRLLFAQVREDPLLEIDALQVRRGGRYIVVSSGGCTALSMLAAGAGHVTAVDLNKTQNHLCELKAVSLGIVPPWEFQGFLGAEPMTRGRRIRIYAALRQHLSSAAVAYWDSNTEMIEDGVLDAGVSERFIKSLAAIVRTCIHSRKRINRLLACRSLAEQRELYANEWNSRRWRALFTILVNRWTFNKAYDPAFFAGVENPSFARHFHSLFERTLCQVPAGTNYFLHYMLTGRYPILRDGGVPPYLDPAWDPALEDVCSSLDLVDGKYEQYLATCSSSSIDGFALSNICEWMDASTVNALFEQVIRVAKPGARVCFRNFVGHTEVPEKFRDVLIEDRDAGARAIVRDRSCVQARIAICRVEKSR